MLAAVYGPLEVKRGGKEQIDRATIDVVWRPRIGPSGIISIYIIFNYQEEGTGWGKREEERGGRREGKEGEEGEGEGEGELLC